MHMISALAESFLTRSIAIHVAFGISPTVAAISGSPCGLLSCGNRLYGCKVVV